MDNPTTLSESHLLHYACMSQMGLALQSLIPQNEVAQVRSSKHSTCLVCPVEIHFRKLLSVISPALQHKRFICGALTLR